MKTINELIIKMTKKEIIEAFADMCIDFGLKIKVDVTHMILRAVAKRVTNYIEKQKK